MHSDKAKQNITRDTASMKKRSEIVSHGLKEIKKNENITRSDSISTLKFFCELMRLPFFALKFT